MLPYQVDDAMNEARIIRKLIHPYIVRCVRTEQIGKKLFIVMEWCGKRDLHQFIKAHQDRPLPEERIWRIFIEVCVGLQYLHSNKILHRDLKPLNIFLTAELKVKIGDVGEAKQLESTNAFGSTNVGTLHYTSPEILNN